MLDLIERLWLQIGPFMRFYARGIREQISIDQHGAALAAIQRRQAPRARRAIERDISEGARFLRKVAEFAEAKLSSTGRPRSARK